jgi:hypothetical protein
VAAAAALREAACGCGDLDIRFRHYSSVRLLVR